MALNDTLRTFIATDGKPPASDSAQIDHRPGAEDSEYDVLDYDDTVDENMDFGDVLPLFYNGGTIDVNIGFMASDVSVGPDDVRWRVSIRAHTPDVDDLDAKVFDSSVSATEPEPSASGEIAICTITLTAAELDGLLAGEYYRLRVGRDPDHGDDDLVGDAELLFAHLIESS